MTDKNIESCSPMSHDSGIIEIMCHPGYPSNPEIGGFEFGPDKFSLSTDRLFEFEFLINSNFDLYLPEKI